MLIKTHDDTHQVDDINILRARYHLIDDYCHDFHDDKSIYLNISGEQWDSIQYFTNTLIVPSSDDSWITLLSTADYLQLKGYYNRILREEVEKYIITTKKGKILTTNLTFVSLLCKIKDPSFLSPEELCRCETVYTLGFNTGRCTGQKEENSKYCSSCNNHPARLHQPMYVE